MFNTWLLCVCNNTQLNFINWTLSEFFLLTWFAWQFSEMSPIFIIIHSLFIHSFIYTFIYSSAYLICSSMDSFFHFFIYLFVHLFMLFHFSFVQLLSHSSPVAVHCNREISEHVSTNHPHSTSDHLQYGTVSASWHCQEQVQRSVTLTYF